MLCSYRPSLETKANKFYLVNEPAAREQRQVMYQRGLRTHNDENRKITLNGRLLITISHASAWTLLFRDLRILSQISARQNDEAKFDGIELLLVSFHVAFFVLYGMIGLDETVAELLGK